MSDEKKMSREELVEAIDRIALRLSNRHWVKSVSKHWLGAMVVRIARLREELRRRGLRSLEGGYETTLPSCVIYSPACTTFEKNCIYKKTQLPAS